MSFSRTLRIASMALAAALLAGAGSASHDHQQDDQLPVHDEVGGEFSAPSSLGRVASTSEFQGKVVLLFFGYTSCRDVCPANLAHLQALTRRLGDQSQNVQVVLVTVDPEVDTPEVLREYLARFDDSYIGFTGTREDTDRIAALFMAKSHESHGTKVTMHHNTSKAFTDEGYLYSHSQQIYLLDKSGQTRAFFFVGSPLEEMEQAVLSLLAE